MRNRVLEEDVEDKKKKNNQDSVLSQMPREETVLTKKS